MDNTDNDVESLGTIFKQGLDLFNNLGRDDEPTNSPNVQLNVKNAMKLFEKATRLVSITGMFSSNESIEEIATNDIQYLLLPSLLGTLSMKLTCGERKEIVDVADIYFKDFLQRCNDYGLSNYVFKEHKAKQEGKDKTEFEKLAGMVNTRANKIQRFRETKELGSRLQDLKKNMENDHVEDEIKRNYFLTMIKLAIYEAIDEIDSIDMERPILEHMANMKDEKPKPRRIPSQPLRPIIITKDAIQKAVFGAGYPSLPTMTVAEFYEQRVKDGIFPDPNKKPEGPMSLQQAALQGVDIENTDKEDTEKEQIEESDDPEYLQRKRDMDEFKDEHRRGWGNRMNRS